MDALLTNYCVSAEDVILGWIPLSRGTELPAAPHIAPPLCPDLAAGADRQLLLRPSGPQVATRPHGPTAPAAYGCVC